MKNALLKIFHPVTVSGLQRLGSKYDGGYVVQGDSLRDADYLVNYGVGYNVDFEKDFYRLTGKPTLAFDPTLKDSSIMMEKLWSGQFIPFLRHVKNRAAWIFKEKELGKYHISMVEEGIAAGDSEKYKSLRYHYDSYELHNKKIVLKIDIEGGEYDVMSDAAIYNLLDNCIQIIFEFHDLQKNIEKAAKIMKRLSTTHSLIHIHSNNHNGTFSYQQKDVPDIIEVTLLNNSYIAQKNYAQHTYPVQGLDQPCHKKKEDIILNFFY